MTYTVHKVQFVVADGPNEILLPIDAEFLTVNAQNDIITLWYRWDQSTTAQDKHQFFTVGTGWPCPSRLKANYVGSALISNGLVWHLFHRKLS